MYITQTLTASLHLYTSFSAMTGFPSKHVTVSNALQIPVQAFYDNTDKAAAPLDQFLHKYRLLQFHFHSLGGSQNKDEAST